MDGPDGAKARIGGSSMTGQSFVGAFSPVSTRARRSALLAVLDELVKNAGVQCCLSRLVAQSRAAGGDVEYPSGKSQIHLSSGILGVVFL
jgi:hypothetical protein